MLARGGRNRLRIADQARGQAEPQILRQRDPFFGGGLIQGEAGRQLEWVGARLRRRRTALFFGPEFVFFDAERRRPVQTYLLRISLP